MQTLIEHLTVDSGTAPRGTVIWLHGLGADGHDFEPIVPALSLAAPLHFVFPHAPQRRVTINRGERMRAWYDIVPGAGPLSADADIRTSAATIEALIDAEVARGVPARRIVLAGFSQGGVIALHTALRHRRRLAGVMGLSTYLHAHERLVDELSLDNASVPILLCHGLMDPMIPIARAVTAREALRALGYDVQWREYAMGHQLCPQEIADIAGWLNDRFRDA
jgi:phospholipase/carboxylesterase